MSFIIEFQYLTSQKNQFKNKCYGPYYEKQHISMKLKYLIRTETYTEAPHVSGIPCVLQTILVAFKEKFQKESAKKDK